MSELLASTRARPTAPHERLRDVRQGPDGALYLLTDNAKGRIAKLVPKQ